MSEILWDKVITSDSFPFETTQFKVVQTHISYVFITDQYVYKIKKAVNFGFLDFTSLEKRRYFCEKEVILNKRLCPDLYLGVVSVVKSGDKYKFEAEGEIVEYAVKMKRLPEDGMMTELLKKGEITCKHIDLINDILVPFYKKAETGEKINIYGSIDTISYNTNENFEQTKDFVGIAISEDKYNYIINYTKNFIQQNKELFEKRIKEGYIREGHGDLYSANICFKDLEKVYIFDCIEFNERFRCGDVCSDIAFLAMDLDYHRFKDLSDYFVSGYVKYSQDKDLLKLLNFYKCYRAYVRGKIGCFTYLSSETPEKKREFLESAQKYFDLAYYYAGGIPKIIIFMGLSGTGKSFLAQKLLEKRPAVYIASDIVRKKLANLDPDKHYYADFEKGIYSPEMTEKTYKKMAELAKQEISYGRDVILDATFLDEKYRKWIRENLEGAKAKIYWIWCRAEAEIVKNRIFKRKEEKSYSDALWEIYLAQKKKFKPPFECQNLLVLDTSESQEYLIKQILKFLKN